MYTPDSGIPSPSHLAVARQRSYDESDWIRQILEEKMNGYTYVSNIGEMTPHQAQHSMQQVHDLVANYNALHHGALYQRSTDELSQMFAENRAVMLLEGNEVVYFGGISPKFSPEESRILDHQLVEFVNAIAHPRLQGNGVGTLGIALRFSKAFETYGDNTVAFLTTINGRTARSFAASNEYAQGRWHAEPVDFSDYPYFAGLTCSYNALGMDDEHDCKTLRRKTAEANMGDFDALLATSGARVFDMPCTLIVSDRDKADSFQDHCRLLHEQFGGTPIVKAPGENLDTEDILKVHDFFTNVKMSTYD